MNTKNTGIRVNNIISFGCILYIRFKVNLSKSSRYRRKKRAAIVLTASMYSSSSSGNEYNNDFHQNPLPHIACPSNSEMYERCSSPIVHTQEEVTLTNDDEDYSELSSSSSSHDEKKFNPEMVGLI